MNIAIAVPVIVALLGFTICCAYYLDKSLGMSVFCAVMLLVTVACSMIAIHKENAAKGESHQGFVSQVCNHADGGANKRNGRSTEGNTLNKQVMFVCSGG